MRRGLPVRKLSIPYHGMTIPIPNTLFHSSPTSNQTVEKMAESSSNSEIQNTTSTEAKVCSGPVKQKSSFTDSPSPPKSSWLRTGRGRALQQLVSQIGCEVGRQHSATPNSHTTSGTASPTPFADDTGPADPAIASTQEEPAAIDTQTTGSNSEATAAAKDLELDVTDNKTTPLPEEPANVEAADDFQVRPKVETPPAESKPPQSPSLAGTPLLSPATTKTPRSSRKSRISLAIQFKGVCSPPQAATVQETSADSELKPSHFTAQGVSTPAEKAPTDAAGAKMECDKNGGIDVQFSRDEELELKHSSTESPETVLTQVSGDDFEDCDPLPESLLPTLSDTSSERGEREDVVRERREELPGDVSSASGTSSEDEEELEVARMGLTTAQLEKSISLHQRNTHRNRVEAKRIQRRIQGAEEVLAADLAEQCAQEDEDSFNYNITEDRENEMAQVLDLQLQFDSQLLEKTCITEDVSHLDVGNHDKLMQMELKLEVEAVEVEKQLQLVRKQAALLQAKTDMTV